MSWKKLTPAWEDHFNSFILREYITVYKCKKEKEYLQNKNIYKLEARLLENRCPFSVNFSCWRKKKSTYFPDLVLADFFLFLRLKAAVIKELNTVSKEGFFKSFENLYELYQKCTVDSRNHFERQWGIYLQIPNKVIIIKSVALLFGLTLY